MVVAVAPVGSHGAYQHVPPSEELRESPFRDGSLAPFPLERRCDQDHGQPHQDQPEGQAIGTTRQELLLDHLVHHLEHTPRNHRIRPENLPQGTTVNLLQEISDQGHKRELSGVFPAMVQGN